MPHALWPQIVGGVPIAISDGNNTRGRTVRLPELPLGNLTISICKEDFDVDTFPDTLLRGLASDINAYFQSALPNVRIIEVLFTCERSFYIVLDDSIQIGAISGILPGTIANCPTAYLKELQLHRLLSAHLPIETHGDVGDLSRQATPGDKLPWPACHIDISHSRNREGHTMMKSVKLESSSHPSQDLRYVVYNWSFMGQPEHTQYRFQPQDVACGSVVQSSDGVVLGFYRYYIADGKWGGFLVSISASEVVENRALQSNTLPI
ncbi:hypothetical protein F5B20DRAFT_597615 [Whalleya microplaca]|nr:hypothetical protein F5B20DRAFT_597615 [Whalleya microplaca]